MPPATKPKPEAVRLKDNKQKAARAYKDYWAAREAGRCVQICCKRKAAVGSVRCKACILWLRDRTRRANRKARKGKVGKERPY